MICKNCNSNIEEGMVLCPSCGKPVQIVPDYNLLDDDALTSLIDEGTLPGTAASSIGRNTMEETSDKNRNRTKYRVLIISAIVGVLLIAIFAILGSKNHHF